jgi:hypothetical protein
MNPTPMKASVFSSSMSAVSQQGVRSRWRGRRRQTSGWRRSRPRPNRDAAQSRVDMAGGPAKGIPRSTSPPSSRNADRSLRLMARDRMRSGQMVQLRRGRTQPRRVQPTQSWEAHMNPQRGPASAAVLTLESRPNAASWIESKMSGACSLPSAGATAFDGALDAFNPRGPRWRHVRPRRR